MHSQHMQTCIILLFSISAQGNFRMLRRWQSTLSTATATSTSAHSALDLEFVLRLLGTSNGSNANVGTQEKLGKKGPEVNLSRWAKVKFNTIELPTQVATAATSKPLARTASLISPLKEAPPTAALASTASASADQTPESVINRLQVLANALPSRVSSAPLMSFFGTEKSVMRKGTTSEEDASTVCKNRNVTATTTSSTSSNNSNNSNNTVITLPTIDYSGRDWSKVTLSSILDKLIPDEAQEMAKVAIDCASRRETVAVEKEKETETDSDAPLSFSLSPLELRLLDYDQLRTLASYYSIDCTELTNQKIETELLSKWFGLQVEPLQIRRRANKLKGCFAWTEAMETLLLRLYDETRAKKREVDGKFAEFMDETGVALLEVRAKAKTADRGLWAVLTDEFSVQAGWRVSLTEVRKKVQILKCLKIK